MWSHVRPSGSASPASGAGRKSTLQLPTHVHQGSSFFIDAHRASRQSEVVHYPYSTGGITPSQQTSPHVEELLHKILDQVLKIGSRLDVLTEQVNSLSSPSLARQLPGVPHTSAPPSPPPSRPISSQPVVQLPPQGGRAAPPATADDDISQPVRPATSLDRLGSQLSSAGVKYKEMEREEEVIEDRAGAKQPLKEGEGGVEEDMTRVKWHLPQVGASSATLTTMDGISLRHEQEDQDARKIKTRTWTPIHFTLCGVSRTISVPIVHPDGLLRALWDILGFVFILWEALRIPYIIAFEPSPEFIWTTVDKAISVYFMCDLVLNFFTAYYRDDVLVLNPHSIAVNYLKTWFWVDFLAAFPITWILPDDDQRASGVRLFRFLKFSRFIRAVKLLRLAKLTRFFQRLEDMFSGAALFTSSIVIFRAVLILLLMSHYFACIWYRLGFETTKTYGESWITEFVPEHLQGSLPHLYVFSMHFTLTTMTTVGYGDIQPITHAERVFTVLFLLSAVAVFGATLGSITQHLSSSAMANEWYRAQMTNLGRYLRWRDFPITLKGRIRRHLEYVWDQDNDLALREQDLLPQLSLTLRRQVAMHVCGKYMAAAPFLKWMAAYPSCIETLAERARWMWQGPGDVLFERGQIDDNVYFLTLGRLVLGTDHSAMEDLAASIGRSDVDEAMGAAGAADKRSKITKTFTRMATTRRRREKMGKKASTLRNFATSMTPEEHRMYIEKLKERIWNSRQDIDDVDYVRKDEEVVMRAPSYVGESVLWEDALETIKSPPSSAAEEGADLSPRPGDRAAHGVAPGRRYTAVCGSHCQIIILSRRDIDEILIMYPFLQQHHRKWLAQKRKTVMLRHQERRQSRLADQPTGLQSEPAQSHGASEAAAGERRKSVSFSGAVNLDREVGGVPGKYVTNEPTVRSPMPSGICCSGQDDPPPSLDGQMDGFGTLSNPFRSHGAPIPIPGPEEDHDDDRPMVSSALGGGGPIEWVRERVDRSFSRSRVMPVSASGGRDVVPPPPDERTQ
ncbi:unnamed protein product [Vitrella brassicaformis CCMP3155]|uniref:Ion transport domain-containing protein n=4 Tax=Vitrella brassicaformis TaxID=1169539 RepID=A0A0G4H199_VITBC|nr:unnamed protein product [Vitrella brassicaformis CCMP3155]|eukprot:CEM37368.1 unnamed protein product [Vitrella brassicaformis CCMP3155]